MNKDLFDIATEAENMNCDLGGAMAVLQEATKYFEHKIEPGSIEAYTLITRQEHLWSLFYVAENMLRDLEKQQEAMIDLLYKKNREEKQK